MPRVSEETMEKLREIVNSISKDTKDKCSICNSTLVDIVKKAEAQTGAGTATVTKFLAESINRDAAPLDRVNAKNLADKVRYHSDPDKIGNSDNNKAGRKPKKKIKKDTTEQVSTGLIEEKMQSGMSVYKAAKAVIEEQTGKAAAAVKEEYKRKTEEYFNSLDPQDLESLRKLEKIMAGEIDEKASEIFEEHKVDDEVEKEYYDRMEYEEFEKNKSYYEFIGSFEKVAKTAAGSDFQEPLLMKARILKTALDYYIKKWE